MAVDQIPDELKHFFKEKETTFFKNIAMANGKG